MGTRITVAVATAAIVVSLAGAIAAHADTLTFVKDNNVWLANADGSALYQVTLDGTTDAPYETPSLADDGTVVAIRQTPGQRRQIYRMTQSGTLLNAPINTPAPGTGAIDGKVSPNGSLVAYWFATTVSDPTCTFCVDVSNRVLLSHSDRFTGAEEVGTPNTGGWPSWVTNTTITLGSGSPTQWYYTLGMPEAAAWFADSDVTGGTSSLLDAEVAPSGDRLAVVRGDNQETILLLKMNGAPPVKPSVANGSCAVLPNPSGKFVDPTWSGDGRTLAWQENDGVWTLSLPANLADCASFGQPVLRVAGAKNPDFGTAALNPGARPACGNPGNPAACPAPAPTPGPGPTPGPPQPGPVCSCALQPVSVHDALAGLVTRQANALRALGIRKLLRKGKLTFVFDAPSAGTLNVRLTSSARVRRSASAAATTVVAAGVTKTAAAGVITVTARLTPQGKRLLRSSRRLASTLKISFTPQGKPAVAVSRTVLLKR